MEDSMARTQMAKAEWKGPVAHGISPRQYRGCVAAARPQVHSVSAEAKDQEGKALFLASGNKKNKIEQMLTE